MANLPPHGEMHDGAHHFPIRVYYEDTDFSGVVYHASYLKFLERGRSEYLRLLGFSHSVMFETHAAFMVRAMQLEFIKPAKIDDILTISTRPQEMKGASFTLSQTILCAETTLVTAEVKIVHVIHNKPTKLPALLRPIFTPF